MFLKQVLIAIILLSPQVFCNGEEPEHTIEEYKDMLRKTNVTLNRIYKTMEMRVQTDKDFIDSSLLEAMSELKLKEKKKLAPRRKRELVKLLENTYSIMKTGISHVMEEETYSDALQKAKHAKDQAVSSFKEIYSFFTN